MHNYRLCTGRRYVECAFGILSNKWRIFLRPLNVRTDFAVVIVKACVVLRNFVREREGCKSEDALTVTGLEDVPNGQSVRGGLTANSVRNTAADLFSNRCWSCFLADVKNMNSRVHKMRKRLKFV